MRIRVARYQCVDVEYGGRESVTVAGPTMTREVVFALVRDTVREELPVMGLPGEDMMAYCSRSV